MTNLTHLFRPLITYIVKQSKSSQRYTSVNQSTSIYVQLFYLCFLKIFNNLFVIPCMQMRILQTTKFIHRKNSCEVQQFSLPPYSQKILQIDSQTDNSPSPHNLSLNLLQLKSFDFQCSLNLLMLEFRKAERPDDRIHRHFLTTLKMLRK